VLATLEDSHGVGIAAPQVDGSAALFIIVASRPIPRDPTAPLMRLRGADLDRWDAGERMGRFERRDRP
jgi:hypothetical protein